MVRPGMIELEMTILDRELGVMPIVEKMVETEIRWLGHPGRRLVGQMRGCVTHLVELSGVRIMVREKILPRTINILALVIQKQKRVYLMESSQNH